MADMEKHKKNMVKNTYKRNALWNAIAGIINALEAVIVVAVVSRVNGLSEAGIVTIAFSFGNLFMTIGKFGMRNYQVAHCGYDVSFKTFLHSRVITTITMVFAAAVYNMAYFLKGEYSIEKAQTIFLVCMWYAVDAFEDVLSAQYQCADRLDIGGKIFSGRWILTITAFIMTDFVSRDIVKSALTALLASIFLEIFFLLHTYSSYGSKTEVKSENGLFRLLKSSMPLCISSFVYFYVTNLPKYAINDTLTDEIQAVYGYISMPVFVISLLNDFIYLPQLTKYILEWREKKTKQFANKIVRQIEIIFFIILICMAGAYVLGIPVLSVLYHADLSEYKMHLMALLAGGGFLAVVGFGASMLTIMDEQKKAMYLYIIAAIMGQFLVPKLVREFGLWGAVSGYTINMLFMALMFISILAKIIKSKLKQSGERRSE